MTDKWKSELISKIKYNIQPRNAFKYLKSIQSD